MPVKETLAVMPMFNQGGRSGMLMAFTNEAFVSQNGGFTYNNSPYVHALNRTLQLEKAAVNLYAARLRKSSPLYQELSQKVSLKTTAHLDAQRQLVKLIFSQQGLPDSDPASFTAVATTIAAKASKWMPQPVTDSLLEASARGIENALEDKYIGLLKLAPAKDRLALEKLLEQVRDFSSEHL